MLHPIGCRPQDPMKIFTYTDARNSLASTLDGVVQDREVAVITRTGRESVVMVAQSEWDAIQSTLHLLSSPRNATRLRQALAELDAGDGQERELVDETGLRDPRLG
jgi:antitoxin YefM